MGKVVPEVKFSKNTLEVKQPFSGSEKETSKVAEGSKKFLSNENIGVLAGVGVLGAIVAALGFELADISFEEIAADTDISESNFLEGTILGEWIDEFEQSNSADTSAFWDGFDNWWDDTSENVRETWNDLWDGDQLKAMNQKENADTNIQKEFVLNDLKHTSSKTNSAIVVTPTPPSSPVSTPIPTPVPIPTP